MNIFVILIDIFRIDSKKHTHPMVIKENKKYVITWNIV
jgi:hypothetical protein